MIVLGIDSSTRTASVGLLAGERLVAERHLVGARDLAATVVPLIDEVLAVAGHRAADIDLVAVSAGPGSFTGLRIGLSVAKGLAMATGCAVAAVSSLEALAVVADRDRGEWICPLLDARRGEVYGALYRATGDVRLQSLLADVAGAPEDLAARLGSLVREKVVLIGDGAEAQSELLARRLPGGVEVLPFADFHPRGGAVARVGRRQFAERGPDAIGALVPRYCRAPEAERKHLSRRAAAGV